MKARLVLFLAAAAAFSQTSYKPSRTVDGHPDLQGIWNIGTVTPFEQPAELGGKQFFTPDEARVWEKSMVERNNKDQRQAGTEQDVANAYNDAWWEQGTHVVRTLRTSIISDPADGHVPALTAAARDAQATRNEPLRHPPAGPEDRSLAERCLFFGQEGPPMASGPYNNNFQIVQSPGYVAIINEALHDTRVIPVDGSPHLPASVRLWLGDSRGHYEGDTLVIETTNFTGRNSYRGSDANLRVTERISRMNAETLLYQFTIDDATAFTQPFSGEYTPVAGTGPIYEYACHEGNYALANMLKGAKAQEKTAGR